MIDPESESHYNVRAAIPEHQEIFESWRLRSAETRDRCACRLDVAYGPSPAETMDIFPAEKNEAPIHMFIHGGYWQAMDKEFFSYIAETLTGCGLCVAIVNYALCPAVSLDEIVGQMRSAAAWLTATARRPSRSMLPVYTPSSLGSISITLAPRSVIRRSSLTIPCSVSSR